METSLLKDKVDPNSTVVPHGIFLVGFIGRVDTNR